MFIIPDLTLYGLYIQYKSKYGGWEFKTRRTKSLGLFRTSSRVLYPGADLAPNYRLDLTRNINIKVVINPVLACTFIYTVVDIVRLNNIVYSILYDRNTRVRRILS